MWLYILQEKQLRALILWVCFMLFSAYSGQSAYFPSPGDKLEVRELMEEGYLQARVTEKGILKGSLFLINNISVSGAPGDFLPYLNILDYKGKAATKGVISAIKQDVDDFLLNTGYVFASVQMGLNVLPVSGNSMQGIFMDSVDVLLNIKPGAGYKVGQIQPGGTRTLPRVLQRLSMINIGDVYNERKLASARQKLFHTGYYEQVLEGTLKRDSVLNILYPEFIAEDVKGSILSAAMGYNSENIDASDRWIGFIEIQFTNLLGTARDLELRLSSRESVKEMRFFYKEPWVLNLPMGVNGDFSLWLEDSVYHELEWGLSIFQDIDFNSKYIISYHNQANSVFYFSEMGELMSTGSKSNRVGLRLIVNLTGNNQYTPTGAVYETGVYGVRRTSQDTTIYLIKTEGQIKADLPVTNRLSVHIGLFASTNLPLSDSADIGDLYRLGGAATLRGYRERELLTNIYIYGNLEWRYFFARNNNLFMFCDPALVNRFGQIERESTGLIYWTRALGYGLGTNLGRRNWYLTLVYALSLSRGISEGLVHVKIENRF